MMVTLFFQAKLAHKCVDDFSASSPLIVKKGCRYVIRILQQKN